MIEVITAFLLVLSMSVFWLTPSMRIAHKDTRAPVV